jgi:alpha-D-xyloside xylohydrolase
MWAPIYRAHGQFPFREPWNIAPEGHPAYKVIEGCLQLRYRLMPYIYSLAADVHFNDYTIMRPLIMDFQSDKNVTDIAYQYMFGPAFLINPIYEYKARQRDVYLPKDNVWYDMYTGKIESNGGETKTVSAPYERIPLYIRGGSIIPVGPEVQYTDEKPWDNLDIVVYPGADAEFTLYEDEGDNYNYEKGLYSTIKFKWNDKARTLTIDRRQGEYPGMLTTRKFNVKVVGGAEKTIDYNGRKVSIKG